MTKLQTLYVTVIGSCLMAAQAIAGSGGDPTSSVPEIDGGSAILATALVAGVVGIIREVKSRK